MNIRGPSNRPPPRASFNASAFSVALARAAPHTQPTDTMAARKPVVTPLATADELAHALAHALAQSTRALVGEPLSH